MINLKDKAWDIIMTERNRKDKAPNWDLIVATTEVLRELKKPKRSQHLINCEVISIWERRKK